MEKSSRFGPELYILVDDPTETSARAVRLGAKKLREPTKMDWGAVVAYVMDMDGYVLAFAKPAK
jgi:predicted enzyme related to lactoylglutathione lyase